MPYHKTLDTPPQLLPLFALYHNLLNFVLPMCSTLERPNPEVPVTNSTNIVDISNVGLTQFWNLKSHMQDASVLATAHYPETLDRIFVSPATNMFSLQLADLGRSLAHLPSFPLFGAGSSDGSIPSPFLKYSYSANTKSNQRSRPTLTLMTFQKGTVAIWTGTLAWCRIWTRNR